MWRLRFCYSRSPTNVWALITDWGAENDEYMYEIINPRQR